MTYGRQASVHGNIADSIADTIAHTLGSGKLHRETYGTPCSCTTEEVMHALRTGNGIEFLPSSIRKLVSSEHLRLGTQSDISAYRRSAQHIVAMRDM